MESISSRSVSPKNLNVLLDAVLFGEIFFMLVDLVLEIVVFLDSIVEAFDGSYENTNTTINFW